MTHALRLTIPGGLDTRYTFRPVSAYKVALFVIEQNEDRSVDFAVQSHVNTQDARNLYKKLLREGFTPSA